MAGLRARPFRTLLRTELAVRAWDDVHATIFLAAQHFVGTRTVFERKAVCNHERGIHFTILHESVQIIEHVRLAPILMVIPFWKAAPRFT